nr:HRDC domain-containing protein [Cerasibacillus terrae]
MTRDGAFIRIFKNKYGKVLKKEGMYSPISQNERHVRILEKILKQEKLMKRMSVKSYVVLANPKTIIHKNNCPKHIQENIYRYDQVTNLIKKELQDRSNKLDVREKYLFEIANFLKENHQPKIYDYERIYSIEKHDYLNGSVKESKNQIKTRNQAQSSIQTKVQFTTQAQTHTQSSQTKSSDEKLRELLRAYRLELSHKEGLKAFMIFTNKEMEELIANRPQSKAELFKLKGFGEKKVAKYGDGIIEIVRGE